MKYQVQIKYTNPSHEHVSLRRRVDTVTRLVEAKSEQEALNRAANQQRALGFIIKEASVVKSKVIKEEVEQIDEGKNEDSKTHWETHVAPLYKKHGLSPKFAKAVDAHVEKYGDSQVWNYHGSAGGGDPHWFDSKKGKVKPLRKKSGYEIAESWEISDEEAEQIDELKASTLGSYISKASKDEVARREQGKEIQAKFKEAGLGNVGIPYDRKLHSKTASRAAGKTLAIKKLTGMAKVTANEEAEQVDERSHLNKQLKNRVMRQIGSHAFIEKGTDEGSPLKTGRKVAKTTPSEKVAKMYRTLPNPVKTAEEVEQVTEAEREAGYKMSPAVKAAQAKSDALSKVKKPAQAGTLAAKKQNMEEEKANVNASKVKLRTLKDKISNRLKTVNMNPTIDSGKL